MTPDVSLQRTPIRAYEIHGIASMMRDLEWLAEDVPAMEAAILTTQRLDHLLRADLEVRSGDQLTARVGDVVLFRALELGPFSDMETDLGRQGCSCSRSHLYRSYLRAKFYKVFRRQLG